MLPLLGALGAAGGAGGATGGIGTAIGAGTGLLTGAMSDAEARKKRKAEEAASRPKNRRLTEIQNAMAGLIEQKAASGLSLAQAAFDMGRNVRI
jgi:hypothetical protein